MLEPGALLDEESRNGTGDKKCSTGVERVVTHAVVHVSKVPQVVSDDPEPEHIRPDHVLRLIAANKDPEPAADRDEVDEASYAVHPVP